MIAEIRSTIAAAYESRYIAKTFIRPGLLPLKMNKAMKKEASSDDGGFTILEEGRRLLEVGGGGGVSEGGKRSQRSTRLIKDHMTQLKTLLEDETTSLALQHAILRELPAFFTPLAQYPTLRQALLKTVVRLWSGSHEEQIRLTATLLLHKFALKHPKLNRLLVKLMYRAFAKACTSSAVASGERSIATVSLLMNGFIEVAAAVSPAVFYEYLIKMCKENAAALEKSAKTCQPEGGKQEAGGVSSVGPAFLVKLICLGRLLARAPGTVPPELEAIEGEARSLFSRLLYCCLASQISAKSYIFFLHTLTVSLESGVYRGQIGSVLNGLLQILQKCSVDSAKKARNHSTKPYVLSSLFKVSDSDLRTDSFNNFVAEEVLYILSKLLVGMQGTCIFADLGKTVSANIKPLLTGACQLKSKNLFRIMLGKLDGDCKKLKQLATESPLVTYQGNLLVKDLNGVQLELPPFLANLDNIRAKRAPMIVEESENSSSRHINDKKATIPMADGDKSLKKRSQAPVMNNKSKNNTNNKRHRPDESEEEDILEDFTP